MVAYFVISEPYMICMVHHFLSCCTFSCLAKSMYRQVFWAVCGINTLFLHCNYLHQRQVSNKWPCDLSSQEASGWGVGWGGGTKLNDDQQDVAISTWRIEKQVFESGLTLLGWQLCGWRETKNVNNARGVTPRSSAFCFSVFAANQNTMMKSTISLHLSVNI